MNNNLRDSVSQGQAIIMCVGHPSTGKTTSTQRLHFELSGQHNVDLLTTMSVRNRLGFMDDLHSEEKRQKVYDEMVVEVERRLSGGTEVIILDGNFNRRSRREAVYKLMSKHDASVFVINCTVPDESAIRERLGHRQKNSENIENKADTIELYNMIKDAADSVDGDKLPDGERPSVIEYDTVNQKVSVLHKNLNRCGDQALLDRISRCLHGSNAKIPQAAVDKVTTFIFDIGGVIQSLRWESVSNRLNSIRPNITMDDFRNALYYEKESCFGLYEVNSLDCEEFWGAMADRLSIERSFIPEIQESFGHLYGHVDSSIYEILKRLARSYKLCVLSNSCPELELSARSENAVYELFEDMYFSHRIGFKKPDRRAYEFVLEARGVKPQECIFVDDLARNISAAEDVGIRGLLYLSPQQLERDLAPYLE